MVAVRRLAAAAILLVAAGFSVYALSPEMFTLFSSSTATVEPQPRARATHQAAMPAVAHHDPVLSRETQIRRFVLACAFVRKEV